MRSAGSSDVGRRAHSRAGRAGLLLLVLAVSAIAPALHVLLDGRGHCDACHQEEAAGHARLAVGCGGPCGDPTHHHHPVHDERQCSTCQLTHTLAAQLFAPVSLAAATAPVISAPPARAACPIIAGVRIGPARAPPAPGRA